jgi:putative aminopeptidase FrvX
MQNHNFNNAQQQWFKAACSKINKDRLRELTCQLVDIHSPTGAEKEVSEFLTDYMSNAGLSSKYQPVNDTSGNAIGEI